MKIEVPLIFFTADFTLRLDVVEYNGTWGDFMLH